MKLLIQVIYQRDRNVPFDCDRKLPKNQPVRHKGAAKSGRGHAAPRVKCVCVGQTQPEKERRPQLGFYSEIQAIFDELSWLAGMTFSQLFASQPSAGASKKQGKHEHDFHQPFRSGVSPESAA
jgi:hypothetical protein